MGAMSWRMHPKKKGGKPRFPTHVACVGSYVLLKDARRFQHTLRLTRWQVLRTANPQ